MTLGREHDPPPIDDDDPDNLPISELYKRAGLSSEPTMEELEILASMNPKTKKTFERYRSLRAQKLNREAQIAGNLQSQDPLHFAMGILGMRASQAAKDAGYRSPLTNDILKVMLSVRDNRKTAATSGHGTGKTFGFSIIALWMLYSLEDTVVITTATSWTTVEKQIWGELHERFQKAKLPLPGRLTGTELKLGPKWYATGLSTNEPERIQGFHSKRVVVLIDEATGYPEDLWDSLESLCVGPNDRILAMGNPTNISSKFKRVCDSGSYNLLRLDGYDHPNVIHNDPYIVLGAITREWIADRLLEYGAEDAPMFLARVRGQWPKQSTDSLISQTVIETAQTWDVRHGKHDDLPTEIHAISKDVTHEGKGVSLGLDVAGPGADLCVLTACEEGRIRILWWTVHRELMETVGKVLRSIREYGGRVRALAVDDSVAWDVPVFVRRQGRWLDIVPIASLHTQEVEVQEHKTLEVLSATGWTRLLHSRRHRTTKELFDVVTEGGRTTVTEDHSLVVGGKETKPQQLSVETIIDTHAPELRLLGSSLSEELAWVMGLFAAEGSYHYSEKHQAHFTKIANGDKALLGRALRVLEETFAAPCWIGDAGSGTNYAVYTLRVGGLAGEFLRRCGTVAVQVGRSRPRRYTHVKKVPIQVLDGNERIKRAFIEGYMVGDGLRTEREWKSDSTSLTLVAGLQYLYECLGWPSSVRIRDDKFNVTTLARLKYRLREPGRVKRVRSLGVKTEHVYDLETESHTFVAGVGFLVHHNTGIGNGVSSRLFEIQQWSRDDLFTRLKTRDDDPLILCNIIRLNFAEDSDDKQRFYRMKDQLWWQLREDLNKEVRGLPPEPELKALNFPRGVSMQAQLVAPIYEVHSSGAIIVYDKRLGNREKTKTLPTRSPDIAHSIMLSNHAYRFIRSEKSLDPPKDIPDLRKRDFAQQIRDMLKPKAEDESTDPYKYLNV